MIIQLPNANDSYVMSGMNYEIQNRKLQSYKHTFDYNFCKRKYNEYARMTLDQFRECLKDPQKLGEIGHLCSFILWVKNKEKHEYRDALGDYGLIHLLFHCLENKHHAEIHAEYIHVLFKEDIKLV
ncbi:MULTISPECIES: hypothetical protein [Aquimarina]|uniref:Uncharacterized protein n=1 Tax=Aquimarina algiphila TaxID=2047982 RepID=A0A554VGA4_9FLAO|nr:MULTISPECIES: hypothetical protein [Aquimarina]TSE06386.1 hypothetical protein FOF46_19705 [Aquimarina algiphila]